jgi:hypothetical protein
MHPDRTCHDKMYIYSRDSWFAHQGSYPKCVVITTYAFLRMGYSPCLFLLGSSSLTDSPENTAQGEETALASTTAYKTRNGKWRVVGAAKRRFTDKHPRKIRFASLRTFCNLMHKMNSHPRIMDDEPAAVTTTITYHYFWGSYHTFSTTSLVLLPVLLLLQRTSTTARN